MSRFPFQIVRFTLYSTQETASLAPSASTGFSLRGPSYLSTLVHRPEFSRACSNNFDISRSTKSQFNADVFIETPPSTSAAAVSFPARKHDFSCEGSFRLYLAPSALG
jgi:hypothetical protein